MRLCPDIGSGEGMESLEVKGPVLHIVVVGFHHKKGCQVDHALFTESTNNCVVTDIFNPNDRLF